MSQQYIAYLMSHTLTGPDKHNHTQLTPAAQHHQSNTNPHLPKYKGQFGLISNTECFISSRIRKKPLDMSTFITMDHF